MIKDPTTGGQGEPDINGHWRTLDEYEIPSQPGMERLAIEKVVESIQSIGLSVEQIDRLKTAVGETTMNAMEHGNHYQVDLPVKISVRVSPKALSVLITDFGGGEVRQEAETPSLEAKLAGLQSPRGWGLYLIKRMVDDIRITEKDDQHTVELLMKLEGDQDEQASIRG